MEHQGVKEGAEVMHQAWVPVEGDVGPVRRVFHVQEQMSNGVVAGIVSGSVLLGHKGMDMPGERLMGEVGRGPVKPRSLNQFPQTPGTCSLKGELILEFSGKVWGLHFRKPLCLGASEGPNPCHHPFQPIQPAIPPCRTKVFQHRGLDSALRLGWRCPKGWCTHPSTGVWVWRGRQGREPGLAH